MGLKHRDILPFKPIGSIKNHQVNLTPRISVGGPRKICGKHANSMCCATNNISIAKGEDLVKCEG